LIRQVADDAVEAAEACKAGVQRIALDDIHVGKAPPQR
jgi:hypothetical protein